MLDATRTLEQIKLVRPDWPATPLPPFLPIGTWELTSLADAGVVAVTLKKLLQLGRRIEGGLDANDAPVLIAEHLRVRMGTPLVAVLHGDDLVLRKFWQSDRRKLLANLRRVGVVAATGPTFSVVSNVAQRTALENICARRQHHQVIQEIHDAGLSPIPNLYAASAHDARRTADWLRSEPLITTVSRDFSRTKGKGLLFDAELNDLIQILGHAGRGLNLFVVGVGLRKAERCARELEDVSASVTFATGDPISLALRQGSVLVGHDVRGVEIHRSTRDRQELARENLQIATRYFTSLSLRSHKNATAKSSLTLRSSALGA